MFCHSVRVLSDNLLVPLSPPSPSPPPQLAAELGAHAVSHLEHVSEAGMAAMAQAGVVGVLLPTTAYMLRLQPPPARKMIDKGALSPHIGLATCPPYNCVYTILDCIFP